MSGQPGGDCFLALPEGSKVLVKVVCNSGQPEVLVKWEFGTPVAVDPFSCAISATCRQKGFVGESMCWREATDGNGVPGAQLQPIRLLLVFLVLCWMAGF